MTNKKWEFELDSGKHVVEFWFSRLSGREKLVVDGVEISNKLVWKVSSAYEFPLGNRVGKLNFSQQATMNTSLIQLLVDETPVEQLPSMTLLRATSAPSNGADTLVRPAGAVVEQVNDQLLRPIDASGQPHVVAVSLSPTHSFSKINQDSIRLYAGEGVEGDAHAGGTVKHRSRVKQNPDQPNLRQVHLMHVELLEELSEKGFQVKPGDIGENITTRGIDLLDLPEGTRLHIGSAAVVEVTGLRNPCAQLDAFQAGLTAACLDHDDEGNLIRKAGVMSVVLTGGSVRPGDIIRIELPMQPHKPLERV